MRRGAAPARPGSAVARHLARVRRLPAALRRVLLVGVVGLLFPGDLLNDEGVNRAASGVETNAGALGRSSCDPGP
jgi:hypothetical protein